MQFCPTQTPEFGLASVLNVKQYFLNIYNSLSQSKLVSDINSSKSGLVRILDNHCTQFLNIEVVEIHALFRWAVLPDLLQPDKSNFFWTFRRDFQKRHWPKLPSFPLISGNSSTKFKSLLSTAGKNNLIKENYFTPVIL